jgi:hypothetical protein
MTKLLEDAFAEASALSPSEQDAVAEWLLTELASERRWEKAFAASRSQLECLADEALEDHRTGRTRRLDPDKL